MLRKPKPSQQHVPRRSPRQRVRNKKTKKWAERSVWSMVCAIELGLMQPSIITGLKKNSETNKPKFGLSGRGTTNSKNCLKPNKSIAKGSTLMHHKINPCLNPRIKLEDDSQNYLSFLDHQYSLPAVSNFPQNFDAAKARNIYYNSEKSLFEKTVVYNPFNVLRDWSAKSNFYAPNELSNDADNESEELPKKPFFKKRLRSSNLVEYFFPQDKQENTASLESNKGTEIPLKISNEEEEKPKSKIPIATVAPQCSVFNNISEPDIYEFNRTIKNQTGPLSAISSSDDSSENDHQTAEDFFKNLGDINAPEKEDSCMKLGKKMQTGALKKVHHKRRYHHHQFWSSENKENRRDGKISEKERIEKKILQQKNKKKSLFCKGKSLSEQISSQENKTIDITKAAIDYENSEEDKTLLVNPLTDLPGSLIEKTERNIDTIDLHREFNVNFHINFEHDSMATNLENFLDQEGIAKVVEKNGPIVEEECKKKEGDESTIPYNESKCNNNYADKYVINTKIKANSSFITGPKKRRSTDPLIKNNGNEDKSKPKWNNDKNMNNIVNNVGRITRGSLKNCLKNETNDINWEIGTIVWGKCMGWWPGLIVDAEDVGMCASEGKSWVFWISEDRISHLRDKTQIQSFSAGLRSRMIEIFRMKTPKDVNYAACLATIKLLNDQILKRGPLTKPYHAWVEKHLICHENIDQFILYPYPSNIQKKMDELKVENSEKTEEYKLDSNESDRAMISKNNSVDKSEMKRQVSSDSENLPLADQKPGVITWAKMMGQMWWPGMIIDFRDCGKKEPKFGCQWILWYGDYTLSQVSHEFFIAFEKGVKKMKEYVINCKRDVYKKGVIDAAKDFCSQYGYKTDEWTIEDVFEWFSKLEENDDDDEFGDSSRILLPGIPGNPETLQKYPPRIIEGLRKHKGNCTVAAIREHNIQDSKTLKSVFSAKSDLKALCLMCLKNCDLRREDNSIDHPFFVGSLCEECSEKYAPTIFAYGDDGKCFFCTVCAGSDTVVMCDEHDCPRVYCTACLKYLIAPKTYDEIIINDPFFCFLCQDCPDLLIGGLIKPRRDWRSRVAGLFHGNHDSIPNQEKYYNHENKKKLRVLSLFDGISSGLVVLNKLGIQVEAYYASEIDPDAEMVSSAHFGHQIIRLGDVRSITEEKILEIAPIHLLIGGSPCNDLSLVNPVRLGLHDPNGTGILVFEYQRIKNLIKKANGETHFFWLFENVASMPSKYRVEINQHLGREPHLVDAANYSPQHRPRLFWSNFPIVSYPLSSQDLQDVLTPNCNRHALVKKIQTVTTRGNSLKQSKLCLKPILMNEENDSLWITELEEIFGFPRHYTDVKNLCATKRQKLIGKAWSIQTIAEIMRPLCNFFQCLNQE